MHDNDNDVELSEDGTQNLRPDARRQRTDIIFREIAQNEAAERRAKTERLRRARLETKPDGL